MHSYISAHGDSYTHILNKKGKILMKNSIIFNETGGYGDSYTHILNKKGKILMKNSIIFNETGGYGDSSTSIHQPLFSYFLNIKENIFKKIDKFYCRKFYKNRNE